MVTEAPYGAWASPISARLVAGGRIRLDELIVFAGACYWLESRPEEGGRIALVRWQEDVQEEVLAPEWSVRTRVHEYGGGAYSVAEGSVFFSSGADDRVYQHHPGQTPEELTASGPQRFADFVVDGRRNRLICVREDHGEDHREPVNELVAIDIETGAQQVLATGNDFYASAMLSPDGRQLAYLTWNQPSMPWDGCELRLSDVAADGTLLPPDLIAGGPEESIFQPQWSPGGQLYFVSDRSGWWNLYRVANGAIEPVTQLEAEFGKPQWVFRQSTYAFSGEDRLVASYRAAGIDRLCVIDLRSLERRDLDLPFVEIQSMRATQGCAYFIGATATTGAQVVRLELETGEFRALHALPSLVADDFVSTPEPMTYSTFDGSEAHATLFRPRNRKYCAPHGAGWPLIVRCHGGPTSAVAPAFDATRVYWTSRGFAVLDVDYGGSVGYGRAYRRRLRRQWGVVDVGDCVAAASHLVSAGEADPHRLIVTGSSAGGYTALCALTFHDVFRAGSSYYGIGNLETLAEQTHKFEARYLDELVGPYPEDVAVYRARSPLAHLDLLSCPIILFQGLLDPVVPVEQAEAMVAALRHRGTPFAYVTFPTESHGFREADTIRRCLEAELFFYARIFDLDIPDEPPPVTIENLDG